MVARHRVQGAHTIKNIEIAKSGLHLLANSTDRVIRQFNLPTYTTVLPDEDAFLEQELEPTLRLLDPVNKVSWNSVDISFDGHWVAGGHFSCSMHSSRNSTIHCA
jgi:COMPASS component SWD1